MFLTFKKPPVNIQLASILLCVLTLILLSVNRGEFIFLWIFIFVAWLLILPFSLSFGLRKTKKGKKDS
jgi:hypothetical protein